VLWGFTLSIELFAGSSPGQMGLAKGERQLAKAQARLKNQTVLHNSLETGINKETAARPGASIYLVAGVLAVAIGAVAVFALRKT